MPELEKGIQLAGRFTLERVLGGGGEARIWLARDKMTSADVALKIVSGRPAANRLRREWQSNLRLLHAHIVRVFEFHEDDDHAFYSMQYIDGPDIGALAGRSSEQILPVIGLVADALRYAHGKDIVHRDVKASNVLLDHNGAPYLCDFGVAAAAGETAGGGSPVAASPQSLGGAPADPADDVFALGCLVFELVSGKPPYPEAERRDAPPVLVEADGSAVPPAVVELVDDMLAREAASRPDAATVVARLRAAGYAPGTAKIRVAGRSRVEDERIETVQAVRRAASAQPDAAVTGRAGTGISPRTLGVLLTVLVAALVLVVFVLPDRVERERRERALEVPVAKERVAPAVGEDAETVAGETGDERQRATREFEPESKGLDDEVILFNENEADYSGMTDDEKLRARVEMILGELLSSLETLERRNVQRWAPVPYRRAQEFYRAGDDAYLRKNYVAAERNYLDALTELEPLFERVEPEFEKALAGARDAFEAGDRAEALRLYELAVAITPNDAEARSGYERARNLDTVLGLVDRGLDYEEELELDAAERSFRRATEIDPEWQPAIDGLARVQATRTKIEFDTRMSEGLEALAAGDYLTARAAFRMAQRLIPDSPEPADGLLQVDQGLRLTDIETLRSEALALESAEDWDAAASTYEAILDVDGNLVFAQEGLREARRMAALHAQLDEYIADPDKLSNQAVLRKATTLVVDVTRMGDIGPRLAGQRDELSRLLKRAATPVPVELVSDNMTTVSVYKVGQLGSFDNTTLKLRPGTYVAVGVRPGFRDVRLEFRVAPEIDMQPVVVRCEERI